MILHPDLAASFVEIDPQPAWIVQPNFEILVYIDEVAPSQMIFLDRYADRLDIQQHTAHYRLTRESVYRGLERGGSLEEFITSPAIGSKGCGAAKCGNRSSAMGRLARTTYTCGAKRK